MNKKNLVKMVSKKTGFSQANSKIAIDAIFGCLSEIINAGENYNYAGFGKFSVYTRPERTCRNPQTGETVLVPEKKSVKFKPSKLLKESVNK